jgi:hypothetical protein
MILLNKLTRLTLILFFIFSYSSLLAQDISEKYPELIQKVKKINKDTSLEKVVLTNEEFMPQMTDGGGELIGYFKKGEIQKISREIVLSYGIETYDYYFDNRQLVFIYEVLDGFLIDSTQKMDHSKTEINFIGRYYFKKKKLIDSETTGHNRFDNEENDTETILLKETHENLNKLLQKRKSSRN